MIDTIHLQNSDFMVEEKAGIKIIPGIINNKTGKKGEWTLFYPISRGGSKPITGKKAFFKGEKVYAVIFHKPYDCISLLRVEFSAPRILRLNNFQLVEKEEIATVFQLVEKELREGGIHCDLFNSKVNRLDLSKNFIVKENPDFYLQALSENIEKARLIKTNYLKTFYLTNKQQEICIYDKIKEMKTKKVDTSNYPHNVLRIEWRLLKNKKIKAVLGIETGKELIEYYTFMKSCFFTALQKNIFYLNLKV